MPNLVVRAVRALLRAAWLSLAMACGSGSHNVKEPSAATSPPDARPLTQSKFHFVDHACSVEDGDSVDAALDEDAARRALRAAYSRAAVCGVAEKQLTTYLTWGSGGCVRFAKVEGVSDARAGACMLDAFRSATIPRFKGPAVYIKAMSDDDGTFSRAERMRPERVQRVVTSHYDRFRGCYEKGLGRDRNLNGRVSVRFVIPRSGVVMHAENAGSTLPDAEVIDCVLRGFEGMRFPAPPDGEVIVVYPIEFEP